MPSRCKLADEVHQTVLDYYGNTLDSRVHWREGFLENPIPLAQILADPIAEDLAKRLSKSGALYACDVWEVVTNLQIATRRLPDTHPWPALLRVPISGISDNRRRRDVLLGLTQMQALVMQAVFQHGARYADVKNGKQPRRKGLTHHPPTTMAGILEREALDRPEVTPHLVLQWVQTAADKFRTDVEAEGFDLEAPQLWVAMAEAGYRGRHFSSVFYLEEGPEGRPLLNRPGLVV